MSFERLLKAKEEVEKRGPIQIPTPEEIQQYSQRKRAVTGQKDKQRECHCGYDQACPMLVCEDCNAERSHNAVCVIERDDAGLVTTYFYHPCRCGAKKWMYGCEKRIVKNETS